MPVPIVLNVNIATQAAPVAYVPMLNPIGNRMAKNHRTQRNLQNKANAKRLRKKVRAVHVAPVLVDIAGNMGADELVE